MAQITVYSSPLCPYCWRARRLLDRKGADYEVIDLMREPGRRTEMIARAGGRHTVPQIFIGDRHIGGSDELVALDRTGELDGLLAAQA